MIGIERQVIQQDIESDYVTNYDDDQIYADATAGNIAVTLTIFGDGALHQIAVQKTDASGHTVTVSDGTTSKVLAAQYDAATFTSDAFGYYHVFSSSIA